MDLYELCKHSNNPLETARKAVAPICKQRLNEYILKCNDCEKQKEYNFNKSLASGNPDANILIINDVATENEEVKQFFNDLLNYSDINTNDVFIINSVSCICKRPDKDTFVERLPSTEEITNCKYFIDYAIQFVRPRIIISMGASALNQYMPGSKLRLMDNINKIFDYNGIKTIATYSSNDLFLLSKYKTEDEIDELTNIIIEAFDKAQDYINNIKKEKEK